MKRVDGHKALGIWLLVKNWVTGLCSHFPTKMRRARDMFLAPKELHLGPFQLDRRSGFLTAATPYMGASGAEKTDSVLGTEAPTGARASIGEGPC